MDLRRGILWGAALAFVAGLVTIIYLRSITIDDGLEALISIPIFGVLFGAAGTFGGLKDRTPMWACRPFTWCGGAPRTR